MGGCCSTSKDIMSPDHETAELLRPSDAENHTENDYGDDNRVRRAETQQDLVIEEFNHSAPINTAALKHPASSLSPSIQPSPKVQREKEYAGAMSTGQMLESDQEDNTSIPSVHGNNAQSGSQVSDFESSIPRQKQLGALHPDRVDEEENDEAKLGDSLQVGDFESEKNHSRKPSMNADEIEMPQEMEYFRTGKNHATVVMVAPLRDPPAIAYTKVIKGLKNIMAKGKGEVRKILLDEIASVKLAIIPPNVDMKLIGGSCASRLIHVEMKDQTIHTFVSTDAGQTIVFIRKLNFVIRRNHSKLRLEPIQIPLFVRDRAANPDLTKDAEEENELHYSDVDESTNSVTESYSSVKKGLGQLEEVEKQTTCSLCKSKFSILNKKSCRKCGNAVCLSCAPHKIMLAEFRSTKPARVCKKCFASLQVDKKDNKQ